MSASAEDLGYGQLTNNYSIRLNGHVTAQLLTFRCNRARVARPSLPHAGDRNTSIVGEESGLVHDLCLLCHLSWELMLLPTDLEPLPMVIITLFLVQTVDTSAGARNHMHYVVSINL